MRTVTGVTIYSRKCDQASRLDIWHKKVIPDASWHVNQKIVQGDNGVSSANVLAVRIPESVYLSADYLSEDEWDAAESVDGCWTIQTDGYIVKGEGSDIKTPKDLKHAFKIISYSDNRKETSTPHWRIGGM